MKLLRLPRRRRPLDGTADAVLFANELGRALGDALHRRPFTVKHEHVYGARPPLPKPARMVIAWEPTSPPPACIWFEFDYEQQR